LANTSLVVNITQTPLQNVSPQLMPMKMTMTSDTMDGNDVHHSDDHQQPMDLLAIQQEIQQNMTSMQLFFTSLPCKHDQSHDQLISIAWTTDPTMMTDTVYHPTKPHTLGMYLTMLHTSTCFVPICMLTQTDSRPPITTYCLLVNLLQQQLHIDATKTSTKS